MQKNNRIVHKDEKLVILFSGGLDSAIAYFYAKTLLLEKNILGLFLDIGQPYALFEKKSVLSFKENTAANITLLEYPFVAEKEYYYEKPTVLRQVIPGRNMTLAAIAANFGTTIWMNALFGELKASMPDKNMEFFTRTSSLLSYTFGTDIIVESPFWNLTKSQTVSLAINELKMPISVLTNTVSCYNPSTTEYGVRFCGQCLTCFKRKVAMVNNDIEENYETDPFMGWYAKSVFDRRYFLEKELIHDYVEAYKKDGKCFDDIPYYAGTQI